MYGLRGSSCAVFIRGACPLSDVWTYGEIRYCEDQVPHIAWWGSNEGAVLNVVALCLVGWVAIWSFF